MKSLKIVLAVLVVACVFTLSETCEARTVLRNICRVKGQEENTLYGVGLVVGLSGTGEANDPATMRALASAMETLGAPITELPAGQPNSLKELEKIKNASFVVVSARVPATGARRGDKLDCRVSGLSGKSLAGGRLAFAALRGPNRRDPRIYALCEGPVHLEDIAAPMSGVVSGGCQMEEDVFTNFVQDGKVTFVLDENHADFQTATEVVGSIQKQYSREEEGFVYAKNASNIVVRVPQEYETNPVEFVAAILNDTEIYSPDPEARVIINERTGNIIISGDVTIGDVVISHKDVVVEAGQAAGFTAIDTDQADSAKLNSLVTALNSIKVPAKDRIEIIKQIARSGKLHGRLIVE
jgi:flagellar P-ring protein precursor FlgI